mmetsp:Transcript_35479/g.65711  ORF Transcript_35479/g.65711 Transcript_35479/m.65711 type:complete len:329 (-) Transcript_35479:152-1138(-)
MSSRPHGAGSRHAGRNYAREGFHPSDIRYKNHDRRAAPRDWRSHSPADVRDSRKDRRHRDHDDSHDRDRRRGEFSGDARKRHRDGGRRNGRGADHADRHPRTPTNGDRASKARKTSRSGSNWGPPTGGTGDWKSSRVDLTSEGKPRISEIRNPVLRTGLGPGRLPRPPIPTPPLHSLPYPISPRTPTVPLSPLFASSPRTFPHPPSPHAFSRPPFPVPSYPAFLPHHPHPGAASPHRAPRERSKGIKVEEVPPPSCFNTPDWQYIRKMDSKLNEALKACLRSSVAVGDSEASIRKITAQNELSALVTKSFDEELEILRRRREALDRHY